MEKKLLSSLLSSLLFLILFFTHITLCVRMSSRTYGLKGREKWPRHQGLGHIMKRKKRKVMEEKRPAASKKEEGSFLPSLYVENLFLQCSSDGSFQFALTLPFHARVQFQESFGLTRDHWHLFPPTPTFCGSFFQKSRETCLEK